MSNLYYCLKNWLYSFWLIDEHRGMLTMIGNENLTLTIPFNAYSRRRMSGSRIFRRKVFKDASKFTVDAKCKLIEVRMQESSVLGKLVIVRPDVISEDAMSVEVVKDPLFRDIAILGSETLVLTNL